MAAPAGDGYRDRAFRQEILQPAQHRGPRPPPLRHGREPENHRVPERDGIQTAIDTATHAGGRVVCRSGEDLSRVVAMMAVGASIVGTPALDDKASEWVYFGARGDDHSP